MLKETKCIMKHKALSISKYSLTKFAFASFPTSHASRHRQGVLLPPKRGINT